MARRGVSFVIETVKGYHACLDSNALGLKVLPVTGGGYLNTLDSHSQYLEQLHSNVVIPDNSFERQIDGLVNFFVTSMLILCKHIVHHARIQDPRIQWIRHQILPIL